MTIPRRLAALVCAGCMMLATACLADTQTAQFIGSASCKTCHSIEFDAWQGSDHGNAMAVAKPTTVLGDFNDVRVNFHGIESRLFQEGERLRITTTGTQGKPETRDIAYSFGHYPLQQYLVDIGDGHLQALNLAWDSRDKALGGQRWYHLRDAAEFDSTSAFFWTRHFQNANSRCIECHTTGFSKSFDTDSKTYASTWAETGVGCEACHGPASRHLEIATQNAFATSGSGFIRKPGKILGWTFRGDAAIASPIGTPDDDFINSCGACHSRRGSFADPRLQAGYHQQYRLALIDEGLYFADGQIDDEVFVLGSFLQSKMHQQGVTCGNCHEPHSGKLLASGNALCVQCHKATVYDDTSHHRHPRSSPGAQCVSCHMPEKLYMQVDARRDHSFSIPDPWLSQQLGVPNACSACHNDRNDSWAATTLRDWGIQPNENSWAHTNHSLGQEDILAFNAYIDDATVSNLAPIRQASLIARLGGFPTRQALEVISGYLGHPDPLLRRAAVSALRPFPAGLRWQILRPLVADPVKSVRLEVAEMLADLRPQLEDEEAVPLDTLLDEYRATLRYQADTPGGQLSLGILEFRLGYSILAERAYLRALDIEPEFVPAMINLADLYRSIGGNDEARAMLRRALDTAPDSALPNHAWGLHLVRIGQPVQALEFLASAIEQTDASPRHAYVYAVALDSSGNTLGAIEALDAATRRWPNTLELYFLQVSYMDKSGNTAGIERYLDLLLSVAGNNAQIKSWGKKYGPGKS